MIAPMDAAFAADVLRANGSDVSGSVTDAAGYRAFHAVDREDGDRFHAGITDGAWYTLIGFGMVEGGWIYLYELHRRT